MDTEFLTTMEEIVASIKKAGYEPYDQLYGYITKGKEGIHYPIRWSQRENQEA